MVNAVVPSGSLAASDGFSLRKKGLQELQKLAIRSPAAMGTLLYLVNNMSRSNALVVSQTAIAAGIGAKRESVNRALKYLREHNFIQSVKAGGATVYVVNSKVAWQGNRGERYAAFGADVLAIEAEQEQDLIDDPRLPKSVLKLIEGRAAARWQ